MIIMMIMIIITCALCPIMGFTKSLIFDTPVILRDELQYDKILFYILFWNKALKLVIDLICHLTRKLPFVTLRIRDNLKV